MLGNGLRRLGHVRHQHHLWALAHERRPAREQLVGQRPHRVDVRPVIDVVGRFRLLGRHVGGRSEGHTHRGELVPPRGFAHGLGDPEVRHERVPAAQHDVVGLDVTVHDAMIVRMRQSVHDVSEDANRLVYR